MFLSVHLNSTLLQIGLYRQLLSELYIWVMCFIEGLLQDSQLLVCEGCARASRYATSFLLSSFQYNVWEVSVCKLLIVWQGSLSPIPFSFSEAAHPLVSTKNSDLWDNLGTKLPLGGFNFRSVRRVIVAYSQPIRFVRLDSEHAESDESPWIADFRCWTLPWPRGRDFWCWPKGARGLWGRECSGTI